MANPQFPREKMSIGLAIDRNQSWLYPRSDRIPFTREHFADVVFISGTNTIDADLEIDMAVTNKDWGR